MGRRMSHSVKRGKSRFEQFRMIVPKDVREVIGKTAWTESLRTTDPFVAREKRAELIIRCTAEIRQAREGIVDRAKADAIVLLDRAFSLLAQARGTMDRAVQLPLQLLRSVVLDSWVGTGRDMGAQWWGDFLVREPVTSDEAIPSFDNERERAMYRLRANLVEGRGIADGLVYQELAAILLDRRVFHPIWCVVSYMRSLESRLPLARDATYEVVAEAFLRRLAEYRFESWPENVADALAPLGRGAAPVPTSRPQPAPVDMRYQGLLAMRLSEGLQYWIDQRRPGQSAVNEARRGVARYIALFGDVIIGTINRAQVIEFRNLIADIPPQTELAKLTAKGQTLRTVIDQAREERQTWEKSDRQMPEPGRLAPGSVKKDVGSISETASSDILLGLSAGGDLDRWQRGESMSSIGRSFERTSVPIFTMLSPSGGICSPEPKRSRCALSLIAREEISRGLVAGRSLRAIATQLGRAPLTISREVGRKGGDDRYRGALSDQAAWDRAIRSKRCKPACHPAPRRTRSRKLRRKW